MAPWSLTTTTDIKVSRETFVISALLVTIAFLGITVSRETLGKIGMACPTCDHTMQNVAKDKHGSIVFWCPRCGTLRQASVRDNVDRVPFLPERTRRLLDEIEFRTNCIGDCAKAAELLEVLEACTVK